MIITDISLQEKNKERCNIFIDGEYSFSLSMEFVIKYRLKKGYEISDAELCEIKIENEKSYALKKATNYISKSLKTKKQIKIYLQAKGFSKKAINDTLQKLTEYGYVDDLAYAKTYLETATKTQGNRLTDYKLMSKGISKDIIEKARENTNDNSIENATAIAKKRMKNKEINKENIMKTYRYLLSRGFSYEEAEKAVSIFKEEL